MLSTTWSILLFIGILGMLAQLLLGGQFGHHQGTHGLTTQGHSPGHGRAAHSSHMASQRGAGRNVSLMLSLISPLTFFSICLGIGATGLLLKHAHLVTGLKITCSIVAGIVFYAIIVRPLSSLMLNFASKPSEALEGALSQPAEVLSRFDATGKGLVKLTVDGQIVRVLATLEEMDLPTASQILPGDRLVVTFIDGHSNACRVARL